LIFIDSIFVVV